MNHDEIWPLVEKVKTGGISETELQTLCTGAITKKRDHDAVVYSFLLYLMRRVKDDSKAQLSALNLAVNSIETLFKENQYKKSPRGNTSPDGSEQRILYCSFCGKSQHEVKKLIAGPRVFICNECVKLCVGILDPEASKEEKADQESSQEKNRENEVSAQEDALRDLAQIRNNPGMYIGGTDERAMHSLADEIISNAGNEAGTGHADLIEVILKEDGSLLVSDNGRGIPIDTHIKFYRPALEVIFTKFYPRQTGPGPAVVNALSDWMWVEVVRDKKLYHQSFARGKPTSDLVLKGPSGERRGTTVCFHPDPEIFGPDAHFSPAWLYEQLRLDSSIFEVKIRWACEAKITDGVTPSEELFSFP